MRTSLLLSICLGCQSNGDDTAPPTGTNPTDHPGGTSTETPPDPTDTPTGTTGTTDSPPTGDTAQPETGDTGTHSTTDTGTGPPPVVGPPVIGGSCNGYAVDTWYSGALLVPELEIFGVYESDAAPGNNMTIDIDRPVEMTVVVSSYSAVNFTIVVHAGSIVDRVIVNGYDKHTVTVTDEFGAVLAVPVDNHSPYSNFWFGRTPYAVGAEANALISDLQSYTGIAGTGFYGCYHATAFRLQ
jgi:hypothetical protein